MNKNKRVKLFPQRSLHSRYQDSCRLEPSIIGYMSVNVSREYHSDLSQLKFLNSYSKGPVDMNLNYNIDAAVKRTTDENNENIELLLKFILDKMIHLNIQNPCPDFITYRRTLISIMCCTYGTCEPIYLIASYYKGSIYLCSIASPQEQMRINNRSGQEEKFCAWGYKFEQYLLSDSPTVTPNYEQPVVENEEFSLFYTSNLGGHKLLYGAQIDGLLTSPSTTKVPETQDFTTNLNYLKQNSYVELKTNREIQNIKQERNFKRYKLMRCWCQCYLAGLKGLLVGYRSDEGIIQRLQWFDTEEIPRYCQNEWKPQKIMKFLDNSLTRIKDCFRHYRDQEGPVSLKLEISLDRGIRVIGNCAKDEILPNWYTVTDVT